MARGLSEIELKSEWQALPRNWYDIYQWKGTSGADYLEWSAEWIFNDFSQIQLVTDGLRSERFRVKDHRGQISLQTEVKQITEKRLIRAMFNSRTFKMINSRNVEEEVTVFDYEVPLKDSYRAKHGDIDLLCKLPGTCLCVEAKNPKSNESILKAVLQAYVYTSLISTKRKLFVNDYRLDPEVKLAPAVLTFASCTSGKQLEKLKEGSHLPKLVNKMDDKLAQIGVAPMRFLLVTTDGDELANCLTTTTEANGDVKAVFRDDFKLKVKEKALP